MLWDVGQILLVQRNTGYPLHVVPKEDRPFGDVDALAADICSAVKRRGEEFESDEELRCIWTRTGLVTTPIPWL